MIKYCGMALCALCAILVLRSSKSEYSGFVGVAASLMLLASAVASFMPVLEFADETVHNFGLGTYLPAVLKALGISLVVQFASELCRDFGESALASKLELIGKAEIMLLCVPLIKELLTLASEMMSF